MSNGVTWDGLDEFGAWLAALPEALAGEADHIVEGAANGAALEVRTAYAEHRVTGNLQEHVFVEDLEHGYRVKSTAPHGWLFEFGAQTPRFTSGRGKTGMPAGLARGVTRAHNIFVPTMIRARRDMFQKLGAMMERQGLIVTGLAA